MKYISILRGINVGGKRKIKMDDLKALYHELACINVISYIQSGNLIFEHESEDREGIADLIQSALLGNSGFTVPVILLVPEELKDIIENFPFDKSETEEYASRTAVTFLSSVPDKDGLLDLKKYVKAHEKMIPGIKEIYLQCPGGFAKTKLTNELVERKLNVTATTRNWRTVKKMFELLTC